MPINGKTYHNNGQHLIRNGSINSHRRSVCSSHDSGDNDSLMV
jgi:hypothetical protein